MKNILLVLVLLTAVTTRCTPSHSAEPKAALSTATTVTPALVTEPVGFDSDDPAIWINSADTANSLIIGTDKNENGALYVFTLDGKIIPDKTVKGLQRPNNVDIEYGLVLNNKPVDVAIVTERITNKLRIFSFPDMAPVDNGGIEVFAGEVGEGYRDPMGIAIYKQPVTNTVYAIVGRKNGPSNAYLWQYLLEDNGHGAVKATVVRKFGKYSGIKEIESIAVDDALGYVYYSDEGSGIHKYYADPEKGNDELALFGTTDFTQDHEGISIYCMDNGKGYILVSDQQSNHFNIYPREGTTEGPHVHPLLKVIATATQESDGSDVTNVSFPGTFNSGLFVCMSTDKTFQLYRWKDVAGNDLSIALNGRIKNNQSQ